MQEAKIQTCVLGPDARIYPHTRDYKGPPGPILFADKHIQEDEEGPYQNIRYFYGISIRVPPIESWPEGASIARPDPRNRQALIARHDIETLRATPEVFLVKSAF